MPKVFNCKIEVPSGSRPEKYAAWLNKHLEQHRMKCIDVQPSAEDERYFQETKS